MKNKKLLIGFLVIGILIISIWWIWKSQKESPFRELLRESKILKFMKSCTKNSDCTLVYGSCLCEAINFKYQDNPEVLVALRGLEEGMQCFINGCQNAGIFSECVAGRCTKVKSDVKISKGCDYLEKEIREKIEKLNYCQIDDDCSIFDFSCPFGCGSYVNKKSPAISEIVEEITLYNSCVGAECEYKCMRPEEPECVNNKCVAKL